MKKKIIIIIFSIVIVIGLYLLIKKPNVNNNENYQEYNLNVSNAYCTQSITYIRKVLRKTPNISSEGLERYPMYNNKDTFSDEEKQLILAENKLLIPSEDTFDSIDSFGNLLLNGEKTGKKLYKHKASVGMYGGDVSDSEVAYSGCVSITPRGLGNYISGFYAPSGELIKITVSEEDLKNTGGFDIIIGQVSGRGHLNNIPDNKDYSRMPIITSKYHITKTETYVGSYFGGPIYIGEPKNINTSFSVNISGGVKYSYFILGGTEEERFIENKKSSAPYFDLEVFDDGVRHSGPRYLIDDLNYQNIYEAAILWYNLASVSNKVSSASHSMYGISFVYDTYVMAGAAVAMVGANWCNLPLDWFKSALDYDAFIKNGSWGVLHEYNHHYQMFGIVRGAETTNNAVTLIEYSLFSEISKYRSEDDKSLTGWNPYTNGYRAVRIHLNEINNKDTAIQSLDLYATLLHSFGPDKMLEIAKRTKDGGLDNFFKEVCDVTKMDMTYYFEEMLNQNISDESKQYAQKYATEPYIPAGLLYANGRYQNDNTLAKSERAYNIKSGSTLDFIKYLALPNGFTVKDIVVLESSAKLTNITEYQYEVEFDTKATIVLKILLNDNILNIDNITFNIDLENYELSNSKIDLHQNDYANVYNFKGSVNKYTILDESIKNFTAWDENYLIDNLQDDKNNKFMHSKNIITAENPFEIILDLNKEVDINYLNFYGYNKQSNEHLPKDFKILLGNNLNNLKEINFTQTKTGNNLMVNIPKTTTRYIKLIISKTTTEKYIALDYIDIGYYLDNIVYKSCDFLSYYFKDNNNSNIIKYSNEYIFGHAIKLDKARYKAKDLFGLMVIGTGKIAVKIGNDIKEYTINNENVNIGFIDTFKDYKDIEITLLEGDIYITSILESKE